MRQASEHRSATISHSLVSLRARSVPCPPSSKVRSRPRAPRQLARGHRGRNRKIVWATVLRETRRGRAPRRDRSSPARLTRHKVLRDSSRDETASALQRDRRGTDATPRVAEPYRANPNGVAIPKDAATPSTRAIARNALALRPDALLVLYVGRLERDKGVADLLVAWKEPPAISNADLILLGSEGIKDPISANELPAECRSAGHGHATSFPTWRRPTYLSSPLM